MVRYADNGGSGRLPELADGRARGPRADLRAGVVFRRRAVLTSTHSLGIIHSPQHSPPSITSFYKFHEKHQARYYTLYYLSLMMYYDDDASNT